MAATIKKVRLNGSSKGINLHRLYKVVLSNGEILNIETNEDVYGDKFHLGSGESASTVWHPNIKSIVAEYNKSGIEGKKIERTSSGV